MTSAEAVWIAPSPTLLAMTMQTHRFITSHRSDDFSLAKTLPQAEHEPLPTQSRAELQNEGGGEWDKTSEVPEVHGA